ncbi:MAG: hypothetical protein SFW66_09800 [Gammaproteobacteria bacterium]|nr:hypothetical protein [Gammaproteobacteria bacterium]
MDNFSRRMGLTAILPVQKESIDEALKNGAWTIVYEFLREGVESSLTGYEAPQWRGKQGQFIRSIWLNFFKLPADSISWNPNKDIAYLRKEFFNFEWSKFYDFIEHFASLEDDYNRKKLIKSFNKVFEQENSAYGFVNDQIIEKISQSEIASVEATKNLPNTSFEHIKKSSQLLFDRDKPDYRNSVKESVSALEAFMRETTKSDKHLGDILRFNNLDWMNAHPSLKIAIKDFMTKIYGYSSDESGVRHSLKEKHREITKEEAWFILVEASALMNYIQSCIKKYD